MKTLWNDVKDWLSDTTKVAIKEAEDLTRKGKLKMEMLALSRRIEKKMAELGGFVYHNLIKNEAYDFSKSNQVAGFVKEIHKMELEMKRKQKESKAKK
jgi:hypothetical protein